MAVRLPGHAVRGVRQAGAVRLPPRSGAASGTATPAETAGVSSHDPGRPQPRCQGVPTSDQNGPGQSDAIPRTATVWLEPPPSG